MYVGAVLVSPWTEMEMTRDGQRQGREKGRFWPGPFSCAGNIRIDPVRGSIPVLLLRRIEGKTCSSARGWKDRERDRYSGESRFDLSRKPSPLLRLISARVFYDANESLSN